MRTGERVEMLRTRDEHDHRFEKIPDEGLMSKHEIREKIKIDLQSIRIRKTGKTILRNVRFDFCQGDRLAVLGPSGAGKTTLMSAILGYLDPRAYMIKGKILFGDVNLLDLSPLDWARIRGNDIRVLFQDPASVVHPHLKISDQFKAAYKAVCQDPDEKHFDRCIDAMREKLFIPENTISGKKYPFQISGGQLQRVAIGLSLLHPARFYFADEPFNSLDAWIAYEFVVLIQKLLKKEHLKSLFLITHDLCAARAARCETVLYVDGSETCRLVPLERFGTVQGFESGRNWVRTIKSIDNHRTDSTSDALPAPTNEKMLNVLRLNYRYTKRGIFLRKGRTIVDKVSFHVADGEFVGMVGNSGAGKSTIGKCVANQMRDWSGQIEWLGNPVHAKHAPDTRIQMLPQQAGQSFDPRQKISDHILQCAAGRRFCTQKTRVALKDFTRRMGLPEDLLHRLPNELSGGQKQLFAIIRSVISSTRCLIADEPFVHLDPILQLKIIDLLNSMKHARPSLCALLISHNLGLLVPLCDRIIVIHQGRIVESAPTHQVLTQPIHEETRKLVHAYRAMRRHLSSH